MEDIFVFGSNRKGIHKRGAALTALNHWGAVLGKGEGIQGTSYAIPTKETPYISLNIEQVKQHVGNFFEFASQNKDKRFLVTKIGCGLAGFTLEEMAPLFRPAVALPNVKLPSCFVTCLFGDYFRDLVYDFHGY